MKQYPDEVVALLKEIRNLLKIERENKELRDQRRRGDINVTE